MYLSEFTQSNVFPEFAYLPVTISGIYKSITHASLSIEVQNSGHGNAAFKHAACVIYISRMNPVE
ncbi:hypothetical protein P030_05905 [Anaplasma phagocytophilum str. CRT35]|nr:hypothetical protein P030_05905 [Anaplasma phagocytophilum str. CRT35]